MDVCLPAEFLRLQGRSSEPRTAASAADTNWWGADAWVEPRCRGGEPGASGADDPTWLIG